MAKMNRYFMHSNEEGILGRGNCYYEFAPFDNEFVAMRQVETDGEVYLSSNLPTQFLNLCDQPLSAIDPEADLTDISAAVFEEIWNRCLFATTQHWLQFKSSHLIGKILTAKAIGFYPHGTLADISESFFGVIDNEEYRKQVGDLRQSIQTKIIGFDEKYRWVILELLAKAIS